MSISRKSQKSTSSIVATRDISLPSVSSLLKAATAKGKKQITVQWYNSNAEGQTKNWYTQVENVATFSFPETFILQFASVVYTILT